MSEELSAYLFQLTILYPHYIRYLGKILWRICRSTNYCSIIDDYISIILGRI